MRRRADSSNHTNGERAASKSQALAGVSRGKASMCDVRLDVGVRADATDWQSLVHDGIAARVRGDAVNWQLGNLALLVQKHYGDATLEKYAGAIGVSFAALRKYRYVASRFENGTRFPNLS